MIDTMLENYTDNQPGTMKAILKMQEIVKKLDFELYNHLINEGKV